jgi:ATP-dependent Lhr-like helicase
MKQSHIAQPRACDPLPMQQATTFHPAVAAWFRNHFAAPTEPQALAWPQIQAGRNVLVAAPTGSGKTLAAFLAAIDGLVREGLANGLPDQTFVVYVSPLKALSNDIQKNLAAPLAGIRSELAAQGLPDVEIRTLVRTGDSPQHERTSMRKRPPHVVVTTPESLYVLLGSDSGRSMLSTTRTVIVDEIHALASNKRGSHLALSLDRLAALAKTPPVRIGLSATQKPIEEVARFLAGVDDTGAARDCAIVDSGHLLKRDLAIAVPSSPLEAVMSNDVWKEVYAQLAQLAQEHRTTLIFVNTRRMAERAARHLSELLGADNVMSHHGSMSKELRLNAEQRLKSGELKVLVATASLELGIDIGDVDLVCQLGSPRSIAAFLQRAGRASHQVGGVPKARLFPLSRDELVECTALLDAVRRGELDALSIPEKPLDVLAQQIVAEVAAQDWPEQALFELYRHATPYAALTNDEFLEVVRTLADGYTTNRGHRGAYVHRDAVNGMLRGRRGARLAALTSGGAIPDTANYDVVLEPAGHLVGTVHEDFAVESLAGDIFQLGNTSYRILRIEAGRVRVEDAHGQPPSIPFWLGEAPGRSDELSYAVSRMREQIGSAIKRGDDAGDVIAAVNGEIGVGKGPASQLVEYLASAQAALGVLPTHDRVVLERFFDESGGMQLVLHTPFGSRINRAWGLALRKRFCVKFDFELQAAATEDAIVLSLSTTHSFALEDVGRYLHSNTVRNVLIQAMLTAPMFAARWRWVAGTSLALPRFRGGKKVPAPLQRMRAEDLMASVFPDQIACAENIVGDREVPDHPLVRQTVHDCLHEAMDVEGLERVLRGIESGAIEVVARDLTHPSPLALEILTARPYAYLDDAPLEERRTQAVMARRWLDEASAKDLGRLDVAAIDRVRAEAWPEATSADEMHDALLGLGFVTDAEAKAHDHWPAFLEDLASARRATRLTQSGAAERIWVAAERLPQFDALFAKAARQPAIDAPEEFARRVWERDEALAEVVRSRLEALGPVTAAALAATIGVPFDEIAVALARLAGEGVVMQGTFTPGAGEEWCDRTLLARIHRYTVRRLREEIEPVATRDFMRFLFRWQHVIPGERREGPYALDAVIAQLQGFEAPAAAWESEILPARLDNYDFTWLDDLCLSGRAIWTRLTAPANAASASNPGPIRTTPVTLLPRRSASVWTRAAQTTTTPATVTASSRADAVAQYLREHGASFFDEIVEGTRMLRTQVEEALAELVALGLVSSDSFSGLRALLTPSEKRKPLGGRKRHRRSAFGIEDAGRWALLRRTQPAERPSGYFEHDPDTVEAIVHVLLRRYGVVFWRLLQREAAWLPPWRDLLRVLRRLEARGDLRGGRFVAGISGEQFALPEAVSALRDARRTPPQQTLVSVSGADPLNLAGILLPGPKVPALTNNRLLYRDGAAIAALIGGEVQWFEALDVAQARVAEDLLIKRHAGSPLLAYLR